MIITLRDMQYADVTVPKGIRAAVLTKRDFYNLPRGDQRDLGIARRMYEKREIEGVFAHLKGKWRWVYKEDYRDLVRSRSG